HSTRRPHRSDRQHPTRAPRHPHLGSGARAAQPRRYRGQRPPHAHAGQRPAHNRVARYQPYQRAIHGAYASARCHYHPRAEIVADIKVALPKCVHTRQLIGAPTGSRKLDHERHLHEVRRHILERYLAFNRPITLVICQQKVDEWLRPRLPDDINIRHYNDVTGLDHFKDVRLMLLIGRTAPGPATPETIAAALTGKCPVLATANGNGFRWFDQVQRGIRLRDGSGRATRGDQHPDPAVEAVRWQICEAELVQALGRGRGVNRTALNPLDADLLFDPALPVTVDEVLRWQPPSLLIETAMEGV